MPAAVYRGPGSLRIEERPVPVPGPGEALVEVAWCGICGSDLHLVSEGLGVPGSVYGHEWTGRIAALGEGVVGLRLGDLVVARPPERCGSCFACRHGRPAACRRRGDRDWWARVHEHGGFAAYLPVAAPRLVRVPSQLEPRAAALAEPLAVALHAITLAGCDRSDVRAVVTGSGPIGALLTAALVERGVAEVLVVEPNPERRALAHDLGAAVAEPGSVPERSADVVFECSGAAAALDAAPSYLASGGVLVLVGLGFAEVRLDLVRAVTEELSVVGCLEYDADGVDQAVALLGRIPAGRILAEEVPLERINDAFRRLAAGTVGGKVLVRASVG
jgi:2-desacetyl-2-hydroxyethyl bacteriochlorophyllide A dehydrogenase